MIRTRWETLDSWLAFAEALGYFGLSREKLEERDGDFYRNGLANNWLNKLAREQSRKRERGMLKTKRWQDLDRRDDGIKICTMRYPPWRHQIPFNMYDFTLAPSGELLQAYRDRRIAWKDYRIEYLRQVREEPFLDNLITVARSNVVTVYCCETTPRYCHRRLIAEEAQKRDPRLRIIVE